MKAIKRPSKKVYRFAHSHLKACLVLRFNINSNLFSVD